MTTAGSRTRRTTAGVLAGIVLATAAAGAVTAFDDRAPTRPAPTSTPTVAYSVQAPDDGSLRVGDATVRQLAGTCTDAGQCRYAPVEDDQLPTVTVPAGTDTLPVKAAQSVAFTVSAFNTHKPTAPVTIGFAGGALLLDQVKAGTYQVSVTGERGGIWQFVLKVTKPTKK